MVNAIVTSGDIAAELIREITGSTNVEPWIDIYLEGPFPAGVDFRAFDAARSRALEAMGWAQSNEAFERLVQRERVFDADMLLLVFDRDPVDMLQLVHFYHYYCEHRSNASLRIAIVDVPMMKGAEQAIADAITRSREFTKSEVTYLKHAWEAVTSSTNFSRQPTSRLERSIGEAVTRRLEQFPPPGVLPRSDRQILAALQRGPLQLVQLFERSQMIPEAERFVTDVMFRYYLERMLKAQPPLLKLAGATQLPALGSKDFWDTTVSLP